MTIDCGGSCARLFLVAPGPSARHRTKGRSDERRDALFVCTARTHIHEKGATGLGMTPAGKACLGYEENANKTTQ